MKKLLLSILVALSISAEAQEAAILNWAQRIGGTGADRSRDMVVDAAGNVYTTGYYSGTVDFDPGAGVSNLTSAGSSDIFISKIDGSGNLVWAKSIGGGGADSPMAIAIDATGNVYITGGFATTADFDPGPGTFNMTSAGQTDIYIAKYDASGNFVWAKGIIGGTWYDHGYSILVDGTGNVHVVGRFYYQGGARDFDPGPGTFFLTADWEDIFILKLDNNGNFIWAKDIGNVLESRGYSVALDAAGNVYTTGYFLGTVDFDPGAGTYNLTSVGGSTGWDVFYSKLDANGNFVWAKAMVNSTSTYYTDGYYGRKIAVDGAGNVYSSGRYSGTTDFDFDAGTFNLTPNGGYDIYLLKMSTDGDFIWAKSIGGTGYDEGFSLYLGATADIYLTGFFVNTVDFDPGPSTFNLTASGANDDIFISKFDTNGDLKWAASMGGTLDDQGFGVSIDASNNVYVSGWFQGTADFDPGACAFNQSSAGGDDMFITKLNQVTTSPLSITSLSPVSGPIGSPVVITGTGFSTTASDNAVEFNGTAAIISASTTTTLTTTVPAGATTGSIKVTVSCVSVTSSTNFTVTASPIITITTQPSDYIACVGETATFTTAATGTTNITFQWQFSPDGIVPYVDITNGNGYSNATTATLSINTTGNFGAGRYQCRVNGDFAAEVISNDEGLFLYPVPAAPTTTGASTCINGKATLQASGATDGEYLWYTVPTGGTSIANEFNSTFLTPSLTTTTTYFVSISKSGCESTRTPVVATVTATVCGPVFTPQVLVTQVEGKIVIDLVPLITTNGTLDVTSIRVTTSLNSGALAEVVDGVLTIDYKGKSFSGRETITIEACNSNGECNQQQFAIDVVGEIVVYNAVSPGTDNKNDIFFLQYIDVLPATQKNTVIILNRWGDVVWETDDYNNTTRVFRGLNKNGNELPTGVYFYRITFTSSKKPMEGFISLKR